MIYHDINDINNDPLLYNRRPTTDIIPIVVENADDRKHECISATLRRAFLPTLRAVNRCTTCNARVFEYPVQLIAAENEGGNAFPQRERQSGQKD